MLGRKKSISSCKQKECYFSKGSNIITWWLMVNVITCKSTRKLGWRTSFSVVTKPLLIFCIKHILCCCSSCSQTTSPIKYVHLFYHYSRYKVTQVSNPNTISLEIIVQSSIRYRALYVESTASMFYTINDQEKKKYVAVRILVVLLW